jgi:hypothetical protein
MPKDYTNVRRGVAIPEVPRVSTRPYVAKSGVNGLTNKEKEARRLSKQASLDMPMNTSMATAANFFSPQLSTDFLELPQSLREKRELYRHFYNTDPIVGQSIDLHTELPLSKVRLATPKPSSYPDGFKDAHDYGNYILWFFTEMCERIKLFQRMVTMVHHYWLDGSCVTPDTLISTPEGERRADSIEVGDRVLTRLGRWRPVEKVYRHPSRQILWMNIARLPAPLKLTGEHPIEVLRGDNFEFVPAAEVRCGDWVRASFPTEVLDVTEVNLLEGVSEDCVTLIPSGYALRRTQLRERSADAQRARAGLLSWLGSLEGPTRRSRASLATEFNVRVSTLNNVILTLDRQLAAYRTRVPAGPKQGDHTLWHPVLVRPDQGPTQYGIERDFEFYGPTRLEVDPRLLYLVGYWLGDGTLTRDSSRPDSWGRGHWSLCFGKGSEAQQGRVRDILCSLFGAAALRVDTGERGILTYALKGNPVFVEWWAANFGCTSLGPNPKRLPTWVLHLPRDKQLHVLAGLIDSDGCCSAPEVGYAGVSISLVSERLVHAIRDILLRVGAVPSMRASTGPRESWIDDKRVFSDKTQHCLWVGNREDAQEIAKYAIKGRNLRQDAKWARKHSSYRKVGSGVALLVRDVSTAGVSDVVNFQVADDSTFRANFVSTHNCFIFAEDSTVEVPDEVGFEQTAVGTNSKITEDGEAVEEPDLSQVARSDRDDQELAYYQKNYQGWSNLIVLPIDQVKVTTYSFTDKMKVELIPAERDRALLEQAKAGDEFAQEMIEEIPEEVRLHMEQGKLIPLGTNADEGSFVYYLAGRRGAGEDLGQSILDRVLRTLIYREKLRQAQTQIASRAMTPKRVVWGDKISELDVMDLREQVDLSLVDPDYSIVANYEVHWEEMGSKDRLLDLSSEYEITDKQLYAGLGVTESLLSGEALYSGDRLKLEVINTRYLFLREMLQEYVENHLFKPVARRKGFIEKNQWGGEVVVYPRLSFTRLPLRDSQDTYDALFNLYNKGSIDISLILEMFNIDPDDTRVKLEKDLFTVNDALFNEVMRGIYGAVGQELISKTDVTDRIIQTLGLKKVEPEAPPEDGRF